MSTREQVFRDDMDRFGSAQYLGELLTVLSDEQLSRLAGVEEEDYDWNEYGAPGPRCVAGHVLDIQTGEYIGPDDPDHQLKRELSRASCNLPFSKISTLIENEVYRRVMSIELPDLPEIEVPSLAPVEV